MAALVDGVVLVQADLESGTRHTVRAVLAQGGRMWVAPWPLGDARFAGNAAWLREPRERVAILTSAEAPLGHLASPASRLEPEGDAARRLLAACDRRFRSLDRLARTAGLSAAEAAGAALRLELAGTLESASGDRYRRSSA
jgi:predicted Rossmann fold nucleotide-binding protein DprA/Smf involved in DNA uptake